MSVGSHRKQMLSMDGGVMEVFIWFFRIISVVDKREKEEGVGKESLRLQCCSDKVYENSVGNS